MGIKTTNNCLGCLSFNDYQCVRVDRGEASVDGYHVCDFFLPSGENNVFRGIQHMSLHDMDYRETTNCFNCSHLRGLFLSHECTLHGISDLLSECDVCEDHKPVDHAAEEVKRLRKLKKIQRPVKKT